MTFLECSGLVTLVRKPKKLEQKMITLPKGSDFANLTDVTLYGEYFFTRKALVVDVSRKKITSFIKGSLISESFSYLQKSPKKVPNHSLDTPLRKELLCQLFRALR